MYTGALTKQIGRFEMAHGSTIFLDEVSELPLDVQAKLLRVLEEKRIERLGSPSSIAVDIRIITTSNQDLDAAQRAGTFRSDLFYRLNVFPITVPPLCERREDIPLLVKAIVEELSATMAKRVDAIPRVQMNALLSYPSPGNVRELRNAVERAMITATGPTLTLSVPVGARPPGGAGQTLHDVERAHVLAVLQQAGWRSPRPARCSDHPGPSSDHPREPDAEAADHATRLERPIVESPAYGRRRFVSGRRRARADIATDCG